jgi:DNA-binding winged helix-turn-helix (wHTH) protein
VPVVDVMMVQWPTQAEQRSRLADQHIPRLLLVDGGFPPPELLDCLEDWIRLPAPEADVKARIDALQARGRVHLRPVPEIDTHGVVRYGAGWIALPPMEAHLAAVLVGQFETVAGRDTLRTAAWPATTPARNVLDVHMLRLRRRFAPLGLAIRTVRARGYVLEPADPPDEQEPDLRDPPAPRAAATAADLRG